MKCNILYREIKKGHFSFEKFDSESAIAKHIFVCADCSCLHNSILKTTQSQIHSNAIEPKPFLFTRLSAKMENNVVVKSRSFKIAFAQIYVVLIIAVSITSGIVFGTISSDKYISVNQNTEEDFVNQDFLFTDLAKEGDELLTVLDPSENNKYEKE